MARTHGRIKVEVWDVGSEFRLLSIEAQWAYEMLLSQPVVTMCGTLPYAPKKWAKLASGLGVERLEEAISELEQAWFVIVDRDSDELLIRTFVKHDEPWKLPNLVVAARRQFQGIESEAIRDYLTQRHEWLVDQSIEPKKVSAYEETRTSERASERTLALPFERASERPPPARDRARTERAQPSPSPSPTPSPSPGEDLCLPGDRSETTRANGLPVENERLTLELLSEIGEHGDEGTPAVVRSLTARLPEGAVAKVLESVRGQKPRNRAEYAVRALQDEWAQRHNDEHGSKIKELEADAEQYVRELGFRLPSELLAEKLEQLLPADEDERIRLTDLAADLRAETAA